MLLMFYFLSWIHRYVHFVIIAELYAYLQICVQFKNNYLKNTTLKGVGAYFQTKNYQRYVPATTVSTLEEKNI